MYLVQNLYQIHQLVLTHFYLHFGIEGVLEMVHFWVMVILKNPWKLVQKNRFFQVGCQRSICLRLELGLFWLWLEVLLEISFWVFEWKGW